MTTQRGHAGRYLFASITVLLTSASCVSGPPPNLYVLNAVTPRPSEAPSGVKSQVVSVGINAVTIPEYLDRSEIVVRSSVNELKARESERWGEPLAAGATRAVTENLAHALPGDVIVAVPTRSKISLDYEINLDLTEFEIDEDGRAVLAGRWSITDASDRTERAGAKVFFARPVGRLGYGAIVAAMSWNIGAVSEEIAAAVGRQAAAGAGVAAPCCR